MNIEVRGLGDVLSLARELAVSTDGSNWQHRRNWGHQCLRLLILMCRAVTATPATSIDLNEKIGAFSNKGENEREKKREQLA